MDFLRKTFNKHTMDYNPLVEHNAPEIEKIIDDFQINPRWNTNIIMSLLKTTPDILDSYNSELSQMISMLVLKYCEELFGKQYVMESAPVKYKIFPNEKLTISHDNKILLSVENINNVAKVRKSNYICNFITDVLYVTEPVEEEYQGFADKMGCKITKYKLVNSSFRYFFEIKDKNYQTLVDYIQPYVEIKDFAKDNKIDVCVILTFQKSMYVCRSGSPISLNCGKTYITPVFYRQAAEHYISWYICVYGNKNVYIKYEKSIEGVVNLFTTKHYACKTGSTKLEISSIYKSHVIS